MRIDVLLGEARSAPADVADRVVIVIDVLRAATTVATALANGAHSVVPFESVDDTRRAALAYEQAMGGTKSQNLPLTAGERAMVRIAGFDLGNSPSEYTRRVVQGKAILFTTTNGTAALVAMQRARASFFAGLVNAAVTVGVVAQLIDEERDLAGVTIVCAGTDGTVSLEDVVCAACLVRGLLAAHSNFSISDSARIALLAELPYVGNVPSLARHAVHAQTLSSAGFSADVAYCFSPDSVPLAVRFRDGVLVPAVARASASFRAPTSATDGSRPSLQVN